MSPRSWRRWGSSRASRPPPASRECRSTPEPFCRNLQRPRQRPTPWCLLRGLGRPVTGESADSPLGPISGGPEGLVQLAEVLVVLVSDRLDLEGRVAYVEVLRRAVGQPVQDAADAVLV